MSVHVGRSWTMSLLGLAAEPVLIEAVLLNGLPHMTIVGLPDTAVNEAKERLRAGFSQVGLSWPNRRLTINLSPADVTKTGTSFDLGIAAAVIGALGYTPPQHSIVLGELGLDATVRGVKGVLPAVLAAHEHGYRRVIVPATNVAEAQLVEGIEVVGVHHLAQVAQLMGVPDQVIPAAPLLVEATPKVNGPVGDFADVRGQDEAILAVEIAAAGGHHVLMVGPPGVGKSMMAQRMPGILPDLTRHQAVEVAAIGSLTGQVMANLPTRPPLAAPHHTATIRALIGGGAGVPYPGAITRAHHGILFLDEFPEFASNAIQSLRQPMENGWIDIDRVRARVRYPAQFQLFAAANPCRCGRILDGPGKCSCSSQERRTYRGKLAGPVRDRIDIRLTIRRPSRANLHSAPLHSADIKQRVSGARDRQYARHGMLNAKVSSRWLRANTPLSQAMETHFDQALANGDMSMRGVVRILRVAWTVADLAGHEHPTSDDIALALSLRG